jgi:hypothetical protein
MVESEGVKLFGRTPGALTLLGLQYDGNCTADTGKHIRQCPLCLKECECCASNSVHGETPTRVPRQASSWAIHSL